MANEIISITVSEDLANQLHECAWNRNITTNQYIRGLIEQDLKPRRPERAISLEESLLKENAGLRLNLYKYKRKYKALDRILRGGLYLKIQGCRSLRMSYVNRRSRADTDEEKKALNALINFIGDEKSDLERIYETCIEAIKD